MKIKAVVLSVIIITTPFESVLADGNIEYQEGGVTPDQTVNQIYYRSDVGYVGFGPASSPDWYNHFALTKTEGVPNFAGGGYAAVFQSNGNSGYHAGIAFIAGSAGKAKFDFGDKDSPSAGRIAYNNALERLEFGTTGSGGFLLESRMVLDTAGNLGIGTVNPTAKLSVNGDIKTKEINVTSSGWSDYVFQDNYNLMPLQELEFFIKEKGHLPGVPTEQEVMENGVKLGEISSILLAKIEELTLHVIALKKDNEVLNNQLKKLSSAK